LGAVCVGKSTPRTLNIDGMQPLKIKAMGRGQRVMCDTDKYGFRRKKKDGTFASPKTVKRVHGFQTGDMVKATVPKGKYQGRILVDWHRFVSVVVSVSRLSLEW